MRPRRFDAPWHCSRTRPNARAVATTPQQGRWQGQAERPEPRVALASTLWYAATRDHPGRNCSLAPPQPAMIATPAVKVEVAPSASRTADFTIDTRSTGQNLP